MKKLITLFIVFIVAISVIGIVGCENNSGSVDDASVGNSNNSSPTISIVVTLSKTDIELGVDETYTLIATISPATANELLTWTSTSDSVAKVDNNGKVTGISAGIAVIKATTTSGVVATCTVEVVSYFGQISGTLTFYDVSKNTYVVDTSAFIYLISENVECLTFVKDDSPVLIDIPLETNGVYVVRPDAQGNYSIDNLPLGNYRLIVRSFKYRYTLHPSSIEPERAKVAWGNYFNKILDESVRDRIATAWCLDLLDGHDVTITKTPIIYSKSVK